MNEKWPQMSKIEKFCLLLGVIVLIYLIIRGDLVVAGIGFLIVFVICVIYVAVKKDGAVGNFVEEMQQRGHKALEEGRKELEEELKQKNDTEAEQTIAKCNELLNKHSGRPLAS